jgi:hypothetical protein
MPKRVTVRVYAGRRERVVVRRVEPPPTPEPSRAKTPIWARPTATPQMGTITARFEHLGALLSTTHRPGTADRAGDRLNTWAARTFETGPFPSFAEAVRENGEFLRVAAPLEPPPRYLYSDRPLDGQGMPLGATEATTGYGLTLGLAREREAGDAADSVRPDRLYALDHEEPHVRRMRSPSEALADWDALRDLFDRPDDPTALGRWEAAREVIARRQQEAWDFASSPFVGKEMTLKALGLAPGLYRPRFEGFDQFHSWDSERPDLYDTFRVPASGDRRASSVQLALGRRQSTAVTCRLVPRRHQILFAWTAVYLVAVLFTSPVYVTEINIGAYADILPLDWRAVSAENDGRNDVAMSRRILRSRRYAVAINQDLGSQSFSPYLIKILVARQDGQWAVRRGQMRAGELAGILDVDRGGYQRFAARSEGLRERYTIYRRTTVQGGQRLNYGRLMTDQVLPYNDRGISVWSRAHAFGAL